MADVMKLTNWEWERINRAVLSMVNVYGKHQGVMRIYTTICSLTTIAHRFQCSVSLQQLIEGNAQESFAGLLCDASNIRHARIQLVKTNLLQVERKGRVTLYRLNLPHILKSLADFFGCAVLADRRLYEKVVLLWKKYGWEVTTELKITEAIQDATKMAAAHRKKQIGKSSEAFGAIRAGKTRVRVVWHWMKTFLEDACSEEGIPYREVWTKKQQTNAKRWLTDVTLLGEDPKQITDQIVRNWEAMRLDLKTDNGFKVSLNSTPNFDQIFKFYKDIARWLAETAVAISRDKALSQTKSMSYEEYMAKKEEERRNEKKSGGVNG